MKFTYDEKQDRGECVAEVFHMDGSPHQVCLKISVGDGRVATFYYDGMKSVQKDFDTDGCSIRKFYPGDKITITF